ncbi:MAG: DUF1569 domain-containing protein [Ferruginibacter sp.]|nr:DUF1569 domain-containing protein [Bacteroidota bacterium]MBX2918122.1 DUF1569 domain-containing protein [Ferruginibacter sp.]MCB0710403.1 DUF1569 domain-containing protein [Chitinophagaceae bacterium]MCC7379382.1 DUF1569 domain-containing protein [Chitinophagaceae bacterium]
MKNLFDKETYTEIINRISKLTPQSQRQWGKMTVSQMLAHCKEAFTVPLSDKKLPRIFMGRLIGWAFKKMLYNDKPWKRNLPTAPNFLIKDDRDFEKEKLELTELINQFYNGGPANVGKFPHPMFGTYTSEQWGKSMYKHLDHHFTQFGV